MSKKTKLYSLLCLVLVLLMATCLFSACSFFKKAEEMTQPYTIQYVDDAGTHTISVYTDSPYSIQDIPSRVGYDFVGLFDAETGGTKYVSAQGASVSVFTDKKNLVLFPQFTPKEYSFMLDYQGAPATGTRQFTAFYDESLADLPTNLVKEHSVFDGWYTAPDCEGLRVADTYGLIPVASVVKVDNFDLTQTPVTLYAGFTPELHAVTIYDETGASEEMQIAYNTPIKEVFPSVRKNGMAPYSFSKYQGEMGASNIYDGKITEEMILYIVEWAPIIEFDAHGGKKVLPIVEKAGTAISLPTTTRKGFVLDGWYTETDKSFTATKMPSQSTKLVAKWNTPATPVTLANTSESTTDRTKQKTYTGSTSFSVEVPTELQDLIATGELRVRIKIKCNASLKYRSNKATATATIKASFNNGNEDTITTLSAKGGGWGTFDINPTYGSTSSSTASLTKTFGVTSASMQFNVGYSYALAFEEYTNWAGGTHAVIFSCDLSNVTYQFYVE